MKYLLEIEYVNAEATVTKREYQKFVQTIGFEVPEGTKTIYLAIYEKVNEE